MHILDKWLAARIHQELLQITKTTQSLKKCAEDTNTPQIYTNSQQAHEKVINISPQEMHIKTIMSEHFPPTWWLKWNTHCWVFVKWYNSQVVSQCLMKLNTCHTCRISQQFHPKEMTAYVQTDFYTKAHSSFIRNTSKLKAQMSIKARGYIHIIRIIEYYSIF